MDVALTLKLILVPLLSAFIGWGTNRLAIRMLFFPRKPIHIGSWKIQGLIPHRHEEIAERTAEIVERELLDTHAIRQECMNIDLSTYVDRYAHELVNKDLRQRAGKLPLIESLVGDSGWERIERFLSTEMKRESHSLLQDVANNIESHIHVRELVKNRMVAFDLRKLEEIIYELASKEFRMIEYLGGFVGLLIGCLQILILWGTGTL